MEPTAAIQIHRRPTVVQPLMVYFIEIDGEEAASLTPGQRDTVHVTPGPHRLQAKALFWSSPELEVNVDAGALLIVDVAPDVKRLWNLVAHRHAFLHVEEVRAA